MTASKRTMDYWHRVDLRVLVELKLGRLPRAADWVPPEDQQQVQCVRLCIRLSLSFFLFVLCSFSAHLLPCSSPLLHHRLCPLCWCSGVAV